MHRDENKNHLIHAEAAHDSHVASSFLEAVKDA